ncbi:MAG: YdcF family protein [Acidobacteriota bacterium]
MIINRLFGSRRKKFLIAIVLLFASWFFLHILITTWDGLSDQIRKADVAVVFGNTVEKNGQPSERLRGRLDKALEIYRSGFVTKIIVSGGRGEEGFEEAEVMRDYLVINNVLVQDIIVDNGGLNTFLTAKNSRAIMLRENMHSVMVISQFFHISRAKLAFAKFGVQDISSAHADYFELRDIYSIVREFFGFYAYLWKNYT